MQNPLCTMNPTPKINAKPLRADQLCMVRVGVTAPEKRITIHHTYIAVFFDLRHFLAARPHHSERTCKPCFRPGGTPSHDETVTKKAHLRSGGGATIRCLYLSGEPSEHLRARVAPPPFAPLRGASSRTDWLGASGRHADIRCGCRMVACSSWPPAPYGRAHEVCSH